MTEYEFSVVLHALEKLDDIFCLGDPSHEDAGSFYKNREESLAKFQALSMSEPLEFYFDEENTCEFSPDELVALAANPPTIEFEKEQAAFFTDRECCICVQEEKLVADIDYLLLLKAEFAEGWSVRLTNQSKLKILGVGFHFLKRYHRKDIFQPELAIEVEKKTGSATKEEMFEIAKSFIFELATTHGVLVSPARPGTMYDDFDEDDWTVEPLQAKKFRPLVTNFEAVSLFLNAEWAVSQDEKLLGYYKVLENFGPSVAKLDSHEKLVHLLSDPRALNPDRAILDNILDVTSGHQNSKDSHLVRLVVEKCCSLHVLEKFPGLESLYGSAADPKTPVKLAEAFYDTRNEVVHAKANYRTRGGEIPIEYRKEAVGLIRNFAEQVIRWGERLPGHLK